MEYQKEVKIKSAVPVYLVGMVWALYAVLLPLYRWEHFIYAALVSAVVYVLSGFIFKGEVIYIEQNIATGNQHFDDILNSLRAYTKKLKVITEHINQVNMHTAVGELTSITESILGYLVKDPEKAGRIRQYENYFLPTTCKLLESYIDMESQQSKGENIKKAMEEIEDAMPGIKKAFHQISNDLYQDKAIDISVEIEVLNKMIGQKTAHDFQIPEDGSDKIEENSDTAD